MPSVCIIGLGYVGLPLAQLCAKKGYSVYGIETNDAKAHSIQTNHPEIKINVEGALNSNIIIIAVPTPIDDANSPDLRFIKSACQSIQENLNGNKQLVILESTVNPFVSRKMVLPMLEESGKKVGVDFYLAHCPERIDPGNKKWDVSNIPRVVGAITQEGLEKAAEFYNNVVDGDIMAVSSIETAEMIKIYENSLRAVNIAFANEMAIIMQNMNLDAKEVISGVKTKPFGLGICYPGPGVGGHCIPVDPFYLINESQKRGFNPSFLRKAMQVNNFMSSYTVNLLIQGLNDIGKSVRGTSIGILGVAYKKDVADTRESPALKVLKKVKSLGGDVKVFDPYAIEHNNALLEEVLDCDAVLILTDHTSFLEQDFTKVPVVIDTRNILNKEDLNGVYKGIGR